MTRFAILLVAALVAVAAPARVWCEAMCLAPAHHADESAKPHCAPPETSGASTSMAATDSGDCAVGETSRVASAKIEFARATTPLALHQTPRHLSAPAPPYSSTSAPPHLASTPLRI